MRAVPRIGDVGADIRNATTKRFDLGDDVPHLFAITHPTKREIPAISRKGARDAQSDAPGAASDERGASLRAGAHLRVDAAADSLAWLVSATSVGFPGPKKARYGPFCASRCR